MAMDNPERDKFYSVPEPPPDDAGELELEPPDETIEERQKQLASMRSGADRYR